jgi:hypothetical protein
MLTIAWDIDDVLNDLMFTWFIEVWKPEHPKSTLLYADISENPPDRILGIPRHEYLTSLDLFRSSARAREMKPNPLISQWLNSFGRGYRHIALTARPLESAPHAAEWLFRHFGPYIRTFTVVPTRFADVVPLYDQDKSGFLSWLDKADFLIDDSEENIRGAEELGIRGILYPQPWNHATQSVEQVLAPLTQRAEVH